MKEVTRLDSAGIGMLVSKFLTARRGGGSLKILHPTERTDHLMDITKLTTVFEIFEDEEAALRSFGKRFRRIGDGANFDQTCVSAGTMAERRSVRLRGMARPTAGAARSRVAPRLGARPDPRVRADGRGAVPRRRSRVPDIMRDLPHRSARLTRPGSRRAACAHASGHHRQPPHRGHASARRASERRRASRRRRVHHREIDRG